MTAVGNGLFFFLVACCKTQLAIGIPFFFLTKWGAFRVRVDEKIKA
jgi:hypothetical protein